MTGRGGSGSGLVLGNLALCTQTIISTCPHVVSVCLYCNININNQSTRGIYLAPPLLPPSPPPPVRGPLQFNAYLLVLAVITTIFTYLGPHPVSGGGGPHPWN